MLPWPDWFTTRSRPAALCVSHPGAAPALLHRTRRHAQSYTRTCTMTACAHAGARTRSRSHSHPPTHEARAHTQPCTGHILTHTHGAEFQKQGHLEDPPHPTVDGAAAQTGAGALTTAARELSAAAWSSSQAPGLLKRSLSPEETPRVAGAEGGGLKHPQPGIAVL